MKHSLVISNELRDFLRHLPPLLSLSSDWSKENDLSESSSGDQTWFAELVLFQDNNAQLDSFLGQKLS